MISLLTLSFACGPKEPPVTSPVENTAARQYTQKPQPLEAPDFQLPKLQQGTLDNGIPVFVSSNHEVPLVYVQLVFDAGSWVSNEENPNLARATLDMLTEGAGELDSAQLSAAQQKLAATISSSASLDGSSISLSSLKQNLEDSVRLFSTIALQPTFPEQDWTLMQRQYIQNLKAAQEDPQQIARSVFNSLMYAGKYAGVMNSVEHIEAVTTSSMRDWYTKYLIPQNAQIVVGGDTTLEEVIPVLNKYFGEWNAQGEDLPSLPTQQDLSAPESTTIYLIDRPGASQSIIRMGMFVNERSADNHEELFLANLAVGGLFIARLNMNLREDKGWTYGARSWVSYNHLPGLWTMSTSVVSKHTADSVNEVLKDLRASQSDKPITQEELDASRGYILGTEPLNYESPNYLLSRTININRYDLPEDWYSNYGNRLRSVPLQEAQDTWNTLVDPSKLTILVVGDAESLTTPLTELGLSVVPLDNKGTPLSE